MFNTTQFNKAWQEWKTHKQEKHGSPYTPSSEEKALSRLFIEAHGKEELAIASIEDSIANNWAKIYIKKNYNNGTAEQPTSSETGYRGGVKDEFNKRYGGW